MKFSIENNEVFPEGYPTPQARTINESSEMNDYNDFFTNYYNK